MYIIISNSSIIFPCFFDAIQRKQGKYRFSFVVSFLFHKALSIAFKLINPKAIETKISDNFSYSLNHMTLRLVDKYLILSGIDISKIK